MQQPSEPAPRLTNEQQLEFTAWLGARYPGAEDDAQQFFVEELSQPQSVGALVRSLPGPFRAHLVASLAVETEAELVQTLVESAARTAARYGRATSRSALQRLKSHEYTVDAARIGAPPPTHTRTHVRC